MDFIGLDFETYYAGDYTLSNMTTESYVRDPRFEVIGVAIVTTAGRSWMEEHQFRAFAKSIDWSKHGVLCHHAHFDGLILSHHYGVIPGYWLDTLGMARGLHGVVASNSLGALAERYGVGTKGIEVDLAKGKHRTDFSPAEWAQYGVYSLNDVDLTLAIFKIMVTELPRTELDVIDVTVRMFTEPTFLLDQAKLAEYLTWERERKTALLVQCGLDKKTLGKNEVLATVFRAFNVEPPMKPSPKQKNPDNTPKMIYAFAKSDPGMQELLEHQDDNVRWLAEARVAVKSNLNESRTERMLLMGANGRAMPVYIKYSAAHTWRFGGGDKVNWQNFEKTNKKNPRKGTIRKSVICKTGYKIVSADASQIEARWNGWHNRQDDLTAQFANREDVYSIFASDAYQRHIDRKLNPEDELPGQVGKVCVLGLGYAMGYLKLGCELLAGKGGSPPVVFGREYLEMLGVDIARFLANPRTVEAVRAVPCRLNEADKFVHFAVANHFVEVYRRKNHMIKAGWKFWGGPILKAIYQGQTGMMDPRGVLELVTGGLRAPNGLVLKYHDLRCDEHGEYSYLSGRAQRKRLHGGVIVENITQFLCRNIMADVMMDLTWNRLRSLGKWYKIAQVEHDAITCVVPESEAGACLNEMIQAISKPPVWAPGLPLAAEGGIGDSFGTAK